MKTKVFLLIFLLVASIVISGTIAEGNNLVETNITTENDNFLQPKPIIFSQEIKTNTEEPLVIKVFNFNIQVDARPQWRDVIKEENPDIAFLDETAFWKSSNDPEFIAQLDDFNTYFADEIPYTGAVITEGGDNAGSVIISRYPIISSSQFGSYPGDDGIEIDFQRNFLDVIIDINGVEVHVIGGHFKCCDGNGPAKRLRTMEELINYFDDLGSVPIIFVGDFNSDSPQDIGIKEPILRSAFGSRLGVEPIEMLLNNSNPKGSKVHTWLDTFRELNPYDPGYTYNDQIEFISRIDYIFVNNFFFDKLVSSEVIKTPSALAVWGGDDHIPMSTTFNMYPEFGDLRPPFRPYDLNGNVVSDTEISINWPANIEVDFEEYNVYRDDILVAESNSTIFEDSSLTSGIIYKYQISSEDNSTNESFLSDPLYVNTTYGILTSPSAPVLTVTAGSVQAILNWTLDDDGGFPVDTYFVFRATETSISDNEFKFKFQTSENSWVDTKAWADKTWYYYVFAINKIGHGFPSVVTDVTPTKAIETSDTSTKTSKEDDSPFPSSPIFIALLSIIIMVPFQRKKKLNVNMN